MHMVADYSKTLQKNTMLQLCNAENLAAFVHNQTAIIAQDIHPERRIAWDICPSRTYVLNHFPSGMNMPNDRFRSQ